MLTVIDVFSKFAFVYPLENKSSSRIAHGFPYILENFERIPKVFQIDRDKGFDNRIFKQYLRSRGIRQQFPKYTSINKAAVVERFNRKI